MHVVVVVLVGLGDHPLTDVLLGPQQQHVQLGREQAQVRHAAR